MNTPFFLDIMGVIEVKGHSSQGTIQTSLEAPEGFFGGLAQLARASDSYSLGPGFESLNRHHYIVRRHPGASKSL